ncbi:MAG: addiction module protein [Planctomycetota bacterium]
MTAPDNKIVQDVLSLPADQRIALVDHLLQSLNAPTQPEIDALWAKEAERRIAEVDSGDAKPIPGEDVFREIRERLKE